MACKKSYCYKELYEHVRFSSYVNDMESDALLDVFRYICYYVLSFFSFLYKATTSFWKEKLH